MTDKNRIFTKDFAINSTKIDTEKREFSAVITDISIDRDKEVLLPSGMDISNFKRNGIILFNHNRDVVLGTALSMRRKGETWIAKGRFAEPGTDQEIDKIWSLVKQGILKAISIGFIEKEGRKPNEQDIEKFGKDVNYIITKFELLEFSFVAVGSNPNTLAIAVKSLNLDPKIIFGEDYKELETEEIINEAFNKAIEREKVEEIINEAFNEAIEKEKDEEDIEKKEIIKEAIEELKLEEDIKEDVEEKIIKIVENKTSSVTIEDRKIDVKKMMDYFLKEVRNEIKRSKGQLF